MQRTFRNLARATKWLEHEGFRIDPTTHTIINVRKHSVRAAALAKNSRGRIVVAIETVQLGRGKKQVPRITTASTREDESSDESNPNSRSGNG